MALTDYELGDRVASTAMSEVWSATDLRNGARVALKRCPPGDRAGRRFAREIEAQRAAAGHHTMPILDWDDSLDWYVMPWADHALATAQVPNAGLVEDVVSAIAESLRPMHLNGQVHRDIKPENVLWLESDNGGRWVLADFGIVRNVPGETTATLTIAGGVLGTSGWMAPEQHGMAHEATPRTDVYAVGAVISWLLTGQRPTPASVPLPPAASRLRAVVWKATREHAGDRYPDVEALLVAIRAALKPTTEALADLVAGSDFAGIVAFGLDESSAYVALAKELPLLPKQNVQQWRRSDVDGLTTVVRTTLDRLANDGIEDLRFSDVDRFLSWSLEVLKTVLAGHDSVRSEALAASLFRAIATIHQFAPAKDVLDWLDRVTVPEQEAMEVALQMADAWEFFSRQASGRFTDARTSPLVRRLSGTL